MNNGTVNEFGDLLHGGVKEVVVFGKQCLSTTWTNPLSLASSSEKYQGWNRNSVLPGSLPVFFTLLQSLSSASSRLSAPSKTLRSLQTSFSNGHMTGFLTPTTATNSAVLISPSLGEIGKDKPEYATLLSISGALTSARAFRFGVFSCTIHEACGDNKAKVEVSVGPDFQGILNKLLGWADSQVDHGFIVCEGRAPRGQLDRVGGEQVARARKEAMKSPC